MSIEASSKVSKARAAVLLVPKEALWQTFMDGLEEFTGDIFESERALLRFLVPFSVLPFGSAAASEYGEIRAYLQNRGTPIGPLDMLIAGHTRAEKLTLVTNNVREFERIPNLEIENWADS